MSETLFRRQRLNVIGASNSNAPNGNLKGPYSPLLAAAGQCNLPLVMELVARGENVNSILTKYNGWTSLHAAVSWDPTLGFLERKPVIEFLVANGADLSALTANGSPLWTLCSPNEPALTKLLIDLGMSVTQRCPLTGSTLLHHWASNYGSSLNEDAVAIVELLLAKGADLKAVDDCGLTPLNVAAMGSASNKLHGYPNEPVLRCLFKRDEISPSEKINALELAGAMILLVKGSQSSSISQAFKYWNEAQDLRESYLIPKVLLNQSINNLPWRATEWTTRTQLVELQNGPPSDISSYDQKIQAILASLRILSRISSKAFVHHLWEGPAQRYCSYPNFNDPYQLDVCWALLEGVCYVTDPGGEDLWKMIVEITSRLVLTLSEHHQKYRSPILNSETLKLSLQLVFDTNKSPFSTDKGDRRVFSHIPSVTPLRTIYNLVTILSENQEMLTNEIKNCLHQFIKRDDRDDYGRNLLLFACDREPNTKEPLAIIRFLLEVGADTTVQNKRGNSPLHLASTQLFDSPSAADLLFAYGAQSDQRNLKGETPLDVWKSTQRKYPQRPAPIWATSTLLPLSFWCARSLRRSQIPLDQLPESLRKFVLQPK